MDDDARKKRNFKPKVVHDGKNEDARGLVVSPEGVFLTTGGETQILADAVDYFWTGIEHDPASWKKYMIGYRYLLDNAEKADREDLRRALNWLSAAIPARARTAINAAARYLAAMPAMLLAGDQPRLMGILNSRILGMVWHVTPDFDVRPLPPAVPTFGAEAGYGLIRSVPELYAKAMDLSPDMETMVIMLATEAKRYGISLPPSISARMEP